MAQTLYEEARQHVERGTARAHALWLLLSDEHERDAYKLKPLRWEGPGEYQHVVFHDGRDGLVKTAMCAKPLLLANEDYGRIVTTHRAEVSVPKSLWMLLGHTEEYREARDAAGKLVTRCGNTCDKTIIEWGESSDPAACSHFVERWTLAIRKWQKTYGGKP